MAKGKQKQKKKGSSGCGFPVVLLVLLCLFVAVAYWKPEVKLSEPVRETVDAVGNRMEEQLADMIGSKQQVISRIEKRENSPSLKNFCNILNALGYELQIVKR